MTERDSSPSSTLAERNPAAEPPASPTAETPVPSQPMAASSTVPAPPMAVSNPVERTDTTDDQTKGSDDGHDVDEKIQPGKTFADGGDVYAEKAIVDVEYDGQVRKAMIVVEEKTGKELLKDVTGGPYTMPQW